jgi:hypothetical protein
MRVKGNKNRAGCPLDDNLSLREGEAEAVTERAALPDRQGR